MAALVVDDDAVARIEALASQDGAVVEALGELSARLRRCGVWPGDRRARVSRDDHDTIPRLTEAAAILPPSHSSVEHARALRPLTALRAGPDALTQRTSDRDHGRRRATQPSDRASPTRAVIAEEVLVDAARSADADGVSLCLVAALFGLRAWLGAFPSPPSYLLVLLALDFVVQPISILVHELGHAGAAALLTRRQAYVVVGRGPWWRPRLGHVQVNFSLLPTRGVIIGGFCRFDTGGVPWRTRGLISLAGPAATLLEFTGVLALTPLLWSSGLTVRYLLAFTLVTLAIAAINNLLPWQPTPASAAALVGVRDGVAALAAFAHHKAGHPPPGAPAPEPSLPILEDREPLPPHWAPADPEQRRIVEAELRRTLSAPVPGEDLRERDRRLAQARAHLATPDKALRPLAKIAQQTDQDRAATSIPPPAPKNPPS